MTPPASWRPARGSAVLLIGPATCQGCRKSVWFGRSKTRVQGATVMGEVRMWRDWGAYRVHGCVLSATRDLGRQSPNRERDATIHALRAEGLTYLQIGSRFGLTRQRVHQILSGNRASRARAKGYNGAVEYSDPIAHNAQRPAVRLYSESRDVDVPEYRRNG